MLNKHMKAIVADDEVADEMGKSRIFFVEDATVRKTDTLVHNKEDVVYCLQGTRA